MSSEDNIKTIQTLYEAFGRGDAETILAALTDDVDWATEAASTSAAWYGPRHGKDAVGKFFVDFGSTTEVSVFDPVAFGSSDDEVFTRVHIVATTRATGRSTDMHLHHYFRFTGGKISFYRGSEDTEQVVATLP